MKAGIRIWMLTGDKRETAINIAQSSALTTQSTSLLILDKKSYDETFAKLESFVETVRKKNFSGI
jgi:P-type E1-E2 ATPase